jgi:zinc transporter ZupT
LCFFLAPPNFSSTATIGILVHSAIDGLALGAISVSDSSSSLELVVFFAIILHKAPAAFGISSFLLHQGRTNSEVRKHLLAFSLAAPIVSLITFILFYYYNRMVEGNEIRPSNKNNGGSSEWSMLLALIFGIIAPVGFSGHSHGH